MILAKWENCAFLATKNSSNTIENQIKGGMAEKNIEKRTTAQK